MVKCIISVVHSLSLLHLLLLNLSILTCGLYLLKTKSEVFTKFVHFKALIENQFLGKIKIFKSDGGGEYTSNEFKHYLLQQGIIYQTSCPYTPQQNGLVERKHRHLIEAIVTLLSQASIHTSY